MNKWRLSWDTFFRISRFGALSAFSFVSNVMMTYALTEFARTPAEVSFLTSLAIIFFLNFGICRWFVFRAHSQSMLPQLLSFFTSTVSFRAVEFMIFFCLYRLGEIHYLASVTLVLIAGFIAKFLFYSRFVFAASAPNQQADESLGVAENC